VQLRLAASCVSAQFAAVKEPAVFGYPNRKGVTIERVAYRPVGALHAIFKFRLAIFS